MNNTVGQFWNHLLLRLKSANMSQAQLARALKTTPQTLSTWKERGQFRRSLLSELSRVLKWKITAADIDQAESCQLLENRESAPRVDQHPAETVLRQADMAYRRASAAFSRYAKETPSLLGVLGQNSFFVFSAATSSPYEFEETPEGQRLADQIACAIARGALCLYIRPTAEGVKYYEDTWCYGRVVRFDESQAEITRFRQRVREKLLLSDSRGCVSARDADRWVYERLDQCYIARSPMWMPGIGLGMAGWVHARDLKTRMTLSLPGGKFGGVLIYPHYHAIEYRFGLVVRSVVTKALAQIKSLIKNGQLEGHVQLDVSPKHYPLVLRFYDRLDQLLRTVASIQLPADALGP